LSRKILNASKCYQSDYGDMIMTEEEDKKVSSYTLWRKGRDAAKYWNKLYITPMYIRIALLVSTLFFFIFTGINGSAKYPSVGETISVILLWGLLVNLYALARYVRWKKRFLVLQLKFAEDAMLIHTPAETKARRIPLSSFRDAEVTFLQFNKQGYSLASFLKKKRPIMEILSDDYLLIGTDTSMIVSFGGEFETEGIHLYLGNISINTFRELRKEWFEKYIHYMKNDRVIQRREALERLKEVSP